MSNVDFVKRPVCSSCLRVLLVALIMNWCGLVFASQLDQAKELLRERKANLTQDLTILSPDERERMEERLDLSVIYEAMNFVEERANTLNYAYLKHTDPTKLPVDTSAVLETGAGICGNQIELFLELVRYLGYEARSVQFYYRDRNKVVSSHIVAEVNLSGHRVLVDVTYQAVFRAKRYQSKPVELSQLMSYQDLRRRRFSDIDIVTNYIDGLKFFAEPVVSKTGGWFDYLRPRPREGGIIVGMNGRVVPFVRREEARKVIVLPDGIPNFIGLTDDHGVDHALGGGLEVEVPKVPSRASLSLDIADVACNTKSPFRLKVYDPRTNRIFGYMDQANPRVEIPGLRAPVTVRIGLADTGNDDAAGGKTCYATWRSATVSRN